MNTFFFVVVIFIIVFLVFYARQLSPKWETKGSLYVFRQEHKGRGTVFYSRPHQDKQLLPGDWSIKDPFSKRPKFLSTKASQLEKQWKALALVWPTLRIKVVAIEWNRDQGFSIHVQGPAKDLDCVDISWYEDAMNALEQKITVRERDSAYEFRTTFKKKVELILMSTILMMFGGAAYFSGFNYVDSLVLFKYAFFGSLISASIGYWVVTKGAEHSVYYSSLLMQASFVLIFFGYVAGLSLMFTINHFGSSAPCLGESVVTHWDMRRGKNTRYFGLATVPNNCKAVTPPVWVQVDYGTYQARPKQISVAFYDGVWVSYFKRL